MVELWWFFLGAVIPVVVAKQAFRTEENRVDQKSRDKMGASTGGSFVCERVCTSKRMMLNQVGASFEDSTVDGCVTLCATSPFDACVDACAKTMCINQRHKLPNWNDVCFPRCQSECLKLLNSLSENSE